MLAKWPLNMNTSGFTLDSHNPMVDKQNNKKTHAHGRKDRKV